MKLAVLGATGSVGREIVTQALAAGHDVTALVREQPLAGEMDPRVEIVLGDVMKAEAVHRAVEGQDAVVSALGHVNASPDDLLACASANAIAAMRAEGVDRLVVLSSPAVDDVEDRPGLVYRGARAVLRLFMPSVVKDHRDQAALVNESELAWTLVRGPLLFTDGPHTGRYHAGPISHSSGLRISRADLADFMLATSTKGDFVRTKPLVSA